jgi:hypothetical protein
LVAQVLHDGRTKSTPCSLSYPMFFLYKQFKVIVSQK